MINLTFICAGVLLDDSILAINQTILRERERERERERNIFRAGFVQIMSKHF